MNGCYWYKYSGFDNRFDAHKSVSLSEDTGLGKKNLIRFGADMSSSVHVDNGKKKLILGKGQCKD